MVIDNTTTALRFADVSKVYETFGSGQRYALLYLGREDFTVTVRDRWRSPKTSGIYPARWVITVPEEHIEVEVVPEMAAQENRSRLVPHLHYWEGAVTILRQRQQIGKGYVELTGYGTSRRPAI